MRRSPLESVFETIAFLLGFSLLVSPQAKAQVLNQELKKIFPSAAAQAVLQDAETGQSDTVSMEEAQSAQPGDLLIPQVQERAPRYTVLRQPGGKNDLLVSLPVFFTIGETGRAIPLMPEITAIQGGIRYLDGGYTGSFLVALRDSTRPGPGDTLPSPVRLQVFALDLGEMSPSHIDIAHTNRVYPGLVFHSTDADSAVRFRVFTPALSTGMDITIPVTHAKLSLIASPRRIQGFGLEQTKLIVELPRGAGQGEIDVTLDSENASPEPRTLRVSPGQRVEASLRSAWYGTVSITAVGGQLDSDPVEVVYGVPWRFLASVLAGSVIGGVLRIVQSRRKRLARFMLEAVLTGLIVTVAYPLGIKLLTLVEIDVPPVLSEALVLTLAALGAYYGLPHFKREPRRQPTG